MQMPLMSSLYRILCAILEAPVFVVYSRKWMVFLPFYFSSFLDVSRRKDFISVFVTTNSSSFSTFLLIPRTLCEASTDPVLSLSLLMICVNIFVTVHVTTLRHQDIYHAKHRVTNGNLGGSFTIIPSSTASNRFATLVSSSFQTLLRCLMFMFSNLDYLLR